MSLANPNGAPGSVLAGGSGPFTWYADIAYFGAVLIPAFATDSIYLDTEWDCSNPNPNDPLNPCAPPKVSVNHWVIRFIQIILIVIVVLIVILITHWFHKASGISADPTSIASTAALMGHPQVEKDFRAIDPNITNSGLKKALKGKKYRLDHYKTDDGTEKYGLVPVVKEGDEAPRSNEAQDSYYSPNPDKQAPVDKPKFGRKWKDIAMYLDILFAGFMIAMIACVASYLRFGATSSFARLFANASYGRRIFFAVFGSVASMRYGQIQRGKHSHSVAL